MFARRWIAMAGIVGAAGCVQPLLRPRDGLVSMQKAAQLPPATADVKQVLTTQLLERPAGDAYVARGVWLDAVCPLGHEAATKLAANGLRIGILGGTKPVEFTALAETEAAVVAPTARSLAAGQPRMVPVNGPLERCQVSVRRGLGDTAEEREYEGAECGLQVVGEMVDGGKMRLTCEWMIQHGSKQMFVKPMADGSALTRDDHKPADRFETLSLQVTLDRDDVLVLGATDEPAGTLGEAYFIQNGNGRIRQRLLTIQAGATEALAGRKGSLTSSRSPAAQAVFLNQVKSR